MKKEEAQVIERYGNPSEFDYAPFLDIILNVSDGSAWVQLSKDDQLPLWERFDTLAHAKDFISKKNH